MALGFIVYKADMNTLSLEYGYKRPKNEIVRAADENQAGKFLRTKRTDHDVVANNPRHQRLV